MLPHTTPHWRMMTYIVIHARGITAAREQHFLALGKSHSDRSAFGWSKKVRVSKYNELGVLVDMKFSFDDITGRVNQNLSTLYMALCDCSIRSLQKMFDYRLKIGDLSLGR